MEGGPTRLFKVVSIGDAGVGKTCLNIRASGKDFKQYQPSIGADFLTIKPDTHDYSLQLWDTQGQERFAFMGAAYFRGSDLVLFVYDVSSRRTFDNIPRWLEEVKQTLKESDKLEAILVANKTDLKREVSVEEGEKWAFDHDMMYLDISVKNSTHTEILAKICEAIDKIGK